MKTKTNHKGKKFGQLTVLDCVVPSNGTNKGGIWLCKCTCRKTINFTGYQLHSRKSCGCLIRKAAIERGKGNRKSEDEKVITKAYQEYKRKTITPIKKEEWVLIIKEPCYYCKDHFNNQPMITESKIISCCNNCRRAKGDMTTIQFYSYLNRLFDNKPNNNCS